MLAIWDRHEKSDARASYHAALEILDRLNHQLLETYSPEGLEPLSVGIGIEQGTALIGFIGPAHRRAQALLGSTVSIAIRIQEMTSDLAQPVLLGSAVARRLEGEELESQGSYLLVGLKIPHVLFAPAPPAKSARNDDSMPKLKLVVGRG